MGQHTRRIPNAALIAASGIVQSQCDGLCAALSGTCKAGNRAIRHRNSVQDTVVAALKVRAQHGVNIAVEAVIRAGFDVRIVAVMGDNLPNEHLGSRILHLTAVTVVHLRIAERQDFLNVTAL